MAETRQFLTRRLRDLLTNLRAFPRAGEGGRIPPSLPRAVVGARLLAAASEVGGEASLSHWLRTWQELLEFLEINPPADTARQACERSLAAFADHAEDVLRRLDSGTQPDGLLTEERRAAFQESLAAALAAAEPGSQDDRARCPLMSQLGIQDGRSVEACLALLHGMLDSLRLPPAGSREAEQLARRWADIRALGDRCFPAAEGAPRSPAPRGTAPAPAGSRNAGRILLLCDISLRSGELFARLGAAGYSVEICGEPGAVLERLAGNDPPRILICDNLEPSRHLQRLAALLETWEGFVPRVVLATGGSQRSMERLARRLGARGVWAPPYRVESLQELIGPPAPD
jgi:CheY-like chemotaxis protein